MTSGSLSIVRISDDGERIVGNLTRSTARHYPFVWSRNGTIDTFDGLLPYVYAVAASRDGKVLVCSEALGGNLTYLGTPPGPYFVQVGEFGTRAYGVSGDGRVVFGISGQASWSKTGFRWVRSPLGSILCTSLPNSTGCHGTLHAEGSPVINDQQFSLTATELPPHRFGVFIASTTPGDVMASGSSGRLCLGGTPGLFANAGQVMSSGQTGQFSIQVDWTQLPTALGSVAAQPGETWIFQAWHRDTSPQPTWNYSDAVGITLQ